MIVVGVTRVNGSGNFVGENRASWGSRGSKEGESIDSTRITLNRQMASYHNYRKQVIHIVMEDITDRS